MKRYYQRGSTFAEYLMVAVALLVVWGVLGKVKEGLTSHQAEYTWSISQPNL